jgi:hypothetical protein
MSNSEYSSIEKFKDEYTGVRDPKNGKWIGLEFCYKNTYYRLNYENVITIQKMTFEKCETYPIVSGYELLGNYSSMDECLSNFKIGDKCLEFILTSDDVEFLGKD